MVVLKVTPDDAFLEKDVVKLPNNAGNMRRFVVGEDDAYRAGFTKFFSKASLPSPQEPLRPMWMDEFFVGIRGRGRLVVRTQPDYDREEVYDIEPGEGIFMGKGTVRRIETLSEEPWVFFYCAIPASSKGLAAKVLPRPSYDEQRDQQSLGTGARF